MFKKLILIVAICMLAGCAGTNFDWATVNSLKEGTPCSEVEAKMGKPYMVINTPQGKTWNYTFACAPPFSPVHVTSITLSFDKNCILHLDKSISINPE